MTASWGPGTVILGRYRLGSLLGRGGMGSVWRAEHLQLRSPVAIKLLDAAISNEQMLARFMREAQSAALLRSPHVVQVLDFGVEDGTAFIAMELLQGESLGERIRRLPRLPAEEVIRLLTQVLRAIGKAHDAGIIHRDLKPDNIFICAEEPEIAKVLDFGVAKVTAGELSGTAGTQPGTMIGTPYYMSPEQMKATGVDARTDLWSIALIAYECLVGSRPFAGEELGELVIAICTGPVPLPSLNASVPPGFDEWFVKGTQRDRELRFGSAREMADALINLSSTVGPLRPQFATVRNLGSVSIPVPKSSASPSRTTAADNLELTTGQRAVTSKSLGHSRPPRSSAVYALIAAAAVLAVGVGAFAASRGASAVKGAVGSQAAAASLTVAVPTVAVVSQVAAAPSALSAPAASGSSAPPAPATPAQQASKVAPLASAPSGSKAKKNDRLENLENQEWRR
ncbi:MAG TPA: serine/threonine-protein kinase [Polyangiaceae bacterium]|nr:serine/threonine-protein kinase [Polyangiaceae bacterium]